MIACLANLKGGFHARQTHIYLIKLSIMIPQKWCNFSNYVIFIKLCIVIGSIFPLVTLKSTSHTVKSSVFQDLKLFMKSRLLQIKKDVMIHKKKYIFKTLTSKFRYASFLNLDVNALKHVLCSMDHHKNVFLLDENYYVSVHCHNEQIKIL